MEKLQLEILPRGLGGHHVVDENVRDFAAKAVHIGVSPLSWVNEVLADLGANTTADKILSQAKNAGYQGVEMSRVFPTDPEALTSLMTKHDMKFVSGWYNGFLAECTVEDALNDVRAHAGLLRACGARVMVYGECGHMAENALDVPLAARRRLAQGDMVAYGARLTAFAEALRDDFGLELAYHHHLMMVAETLDEIRAVMAHTGPAVGLLLDTGHAAAAGFDYAQLITEFASRICHIHLKDIRPDILSDVRTKGISFNDGVRMGMFTVPGDGSIDFAPMAEFVASGVYSGWLVVEAEQDPAKAAPAEVVARAYRFVTDTVLNADHGRAQAQGAI